MTTEEAEAALQAWATVQRDELILAAHQAGVSKNRIHVLTGTARTTIDRILENPPGATRQRIASYLDKLTAQWPRPPHGSDWTQPVMSSKYSPADLAVQLLADPGFRELKLGTWLSTPADELITGAVTAMTQPLRRPDADLLTAAMRIASQNQQAEAREKIAAGLAVAGLVALAVGAARG
jgi:hypothetical protein